MSNKHTTCKSRKFPNRETIFAKCPFKISCRLEQQNGSIYMWDMFSFSDTPVCKRIEISAKYHERQERGDISHVTCSLYASPGNVTFYWMTRNSSSNHSWSTGGDSHAKVWREGDLIELLCWGENEIGLQKMPCRLRIPDGSVQIMCY